MLHKLKTMVLLLIAAIATMAPVCVLSGGDTSTTSSTIELGSRAIVEVIGENSEVRVRRVTSDSLELQATFYNSEFVDFYTRSLTSEPSEHFIISATTSTGGQTSANSIIELGIPDGVNLIVRTTNRPIIIAGAVLSSGELSTTNGKISVRNSTGDYDLETTNSEVTVQDVDGNVNISTTNAHVWFDGLITKGTNTISTTNGDIAVRLQAGSDVAVSVSTHNGEVTIESGDTGVTKYGDRATLEHSFTDGVATLNITNGPGAIHINPKIISVFDEDHVQPQTSR